jgi:hypothetical protein
VDCIPTIKSFYFLLRELKFLQEPFLPYACNMLESTSNDNATTSWLWKHDCICTRMRMKTRLGSQSKVKIRELTPRRHHRFGCEDNLFIGF